MGEGDHEDDGAARWTLVHVDLVGGGARRAVVGGGDLDRQIPVGSKHLRDKKSAKPA